MVYHFITFGNLSGSSLLPAHGSGGARATIKIKAPQKNRAKPEKQKGKKEGGLGEGIFALLRLRIERFRFSLNKRNTKQINFLFLLKEKIAREKIKKCGENFSVLVPPKRSGGGRKRTSLFWILFKESSNIVQKTPQQSQEGRDEKFTRCLAGVPPSPLFLSRLIAPPELMVNS